MVKNELTIPIKTVGPSVQVWMLFTATGSYTH